MSSPHIGVSTFEPQEVRSVRVLETNSSIVLVFYCLHLIVLNFIVLRPYCLASYNSKYWPTYPIVLTSIVAASYLYLPIVLPRTEVVYIVA